VSLVTILLAGCQPLLGLGQSPGWSVRADNSTVGIDYVLRYTSSKAPVYRLLPSGSDGVVQSGKGSRDPGSALAVLDPVSCREVSIVDPIADDYTSVSLSIEGTPSAGAYDPEDYGDPSDPAQLLAGTDTCATSDPAVTPKPAPSMVAGEWLNGWEMYCVAAGNGAFGVRGEFLNGAVAGCEAHPADIGQGAIDSPNGVSIWNPDGDKSRLGVAWEDTACANGATVSLYPTVAGYRAHTISIGSACAPAMKPYAVVFFLTEPIDASLVRGEVERIIE
jgi:hypothetical protein